MPEEDKIMKDTIKLIIYDEVEDGGLGTEIAVNRIASYVEEHYVRKELLQKWAKGHLIQDKLSSNWYFELNEGMIETLGLKGD